MKKIHIVLIILVAIISAILVSTYTSAVDSTTFDVAHTKPGQQVKITGNFDKTKGVEYDQMKNADLTIFNVIDGKGNTEKVYLTDKGGKPLGLEMSESVTIEGKYAEDGTFQASHMLMKCPSKYNEQKHSLAGAAQ
jgi:cytochrome c-type biogenesis protein CcmE